MARDGKQLEALVAFIEKILLPQGFEVKTNERVYNEDGVQIAEFDVEVRGKIGSTSFAWLVECRDRPGDGPAPGSWIEQLVGRRTRFRFNKVTAVSTTGFAVGAVQFARSQGIELRDVTALNPDEFASWLVIRHLQQTEKSTVLTHASILVDESESDERTRALLDAMSRTPATAAFLQPSKGGEGVAPAHAFLAAVEAVGTLFDDLLPNGPGKSIELAVRYTNDEDHFVVETPLGPIQVRSIIFRGELRIKESLVPLSVTAEYRDAETGQPISQLATFLPQEMNGTKFSLELHRIAESGETHMALRKVEDGN